MLSSVGDMFAFMLTVGIMAVVLGVFFIPFMYGIIMKGFGLDRDGRSNEKDKLDERIPHS